MADEDNKLAPDDYELTWKLESIAKLNGWHRSGRYISPRKVILTFEKDLEPEPGLGRSDPA